MSLPGRLLTDLPLHSCRPARGSGERRHRANSDPVPTIATASHLAAEPLSINQVPMACHIATAASHRSSELLLKAKGGIAIAVVSSRHRKRRQPGFATGDPELVGWPQLVRGIQRS